MHNALRQLSILVRRRPAVAWMTAAVAAVLTWWLALDVHDAESRVLLLSAALIVSGLLLVLGLMVQALVADTGTAEREVARMATTDLLTGALNRRGFMAAAGQEFTRATRYER